MELSDYTEKFYEAAKKTIADQSSNIEELIQLILECYKRDGKLLIAGNGGFAALSSHIASELVGRYNDPERRPLAAISLSADISILTAIANDFGYENLFIRQISAYASHNDILLTLSCSGKSPNLLKLIDHCKKIDIRTVNLTGLVDCSTRSHLCCNIRGLSHIQVSSSECSIIQEVALQILHYVCYRVDVELGSSH